jgi:nicotinamidase-related amidase
VAGSRSGGEVASGIALLLIDLIGRYDFDEADGVLEVALPMARRIGRLRQQTDRFGIPAIYVNDNFGRWRSDFRQLVTRSTRRDAPGRRIARLLRPKARDYFVLKPRHSAFFDTPLAQLLTHLECRTLILTGILADVCILFTANDAYMRGYRLVVPGDCIAARTEADRRRSLAHMRRALSADTRSAGRLDIDRLRHQHRASR